MSTGGFSNFENESTADYISEVIINGYGLIEIALDRILEGNDSSGIFECEEALIASEMIAAACMRPANDFPENAAEWVAALISEDGIEKEKIIALKDKAAEAIDVIVTDSELKILWEETKFFDLWFKAQQDLQNRLLDE